MPECPWCQASIGDARFPCRSCGRRPKDHVSQLQPRPGMLVETPPPVGPGVVDVQQAARLVREARAPRDLGEPMGEEAAAAAVPDLVLEPHVTSRAAPTTPALAEPPAATTASEVPSLVPPPLKPRVPVEIAGGPGDLAVPPPRVQRAPPAPGPGPSGGGGSAFDDMEMMSNDFGSIDLAAGHGGDATAAPAAQVAVLARPVSTVLESEDGGVLAARRLGDYGDAPAEWWKTPFYAYRVKMRQLELRRALASKRAELEKAQDAASDALVIFAERGRKSIVQKASYAKLLDAVADAETALRERDSALAAEADAHAQKTAGLDAQITQLEAELAGARAEENAYADTFARVDAVRQRADAKVKRVDIDLRSAVARATAAAAARGGPTAVKAPVDLDVAAVTAEREARLAELEQAMPAVIDATQKLTAARRKSTGIEQKVRVIKNERAALEVAFRKRGATHGAAVAKAQKVVRQALADLGRAASADQANFGSEYDELRREIVELDRVTVRRDDEVMIHVMALDAHDAPKVQTGVAILAGATLLVIIMAILPVVVSAATAPKTPPPAATVNLASP